MMRDAPRTPEMVTAYDPLDLHMQRLGVPRRSTWSKVSSRAVLLLVTGVALGPEGLAVLTPEILAVIQPAIPVALAVLGVTAVFESPEHGAFSRRAFLLSSTAILATGLAIALRQRAAVDALAMVGQAAAIAILLAAAGWMLSSPGAATRSGASSPSPRCCCSAAWRTTFRCPGCCSGGWPRRPGASCGRRWPTCAWTRRTCNIPVWRSC